MSAALTGLNQIPGVIGSAIFNADDQCVVHMLPPPYDTALLAAVMVEVRNALNVLNYLDDSSTWTAVVIRYDAGYLVVRNVHKMTVLVIAQPSLNPAMLSVGFNVAALKLEKEVVPTAPPPPPPPPPAPTPQPRAASQSTPATGHTPHPRVVPRATTNHPNQTAAAPATPVSLSVSQSGSGAHGLTSQSGSGTHSLSTSQSGGGTHPGSQSSPRLASASVSGGFRSDSLDQGIVVPDAVGKAVLDGVLRALARHIGPFAKLIMKEELAELGATASTLGLSQYEDFIGLLSRRLQDPVKRREFMTEAEALPQKR